VILKSCVLHCVVYLLINSFQVCHSRWPKTNGCESKCKAPIYTLNPQADPYPRSIPKRRWSRPIHTSRSPRADPYPNFDTIPNMFKSFWNEIVKNWNPKIPCQIYRKMKQYGISVIEDEGTHACEKWNGANVWNHDWTILADTAANSWLGESKIECRKLVYPLWMGVPGKKHL